LNALETPISGKRSFKSKRIGGRIVDEAEQPRLAHAADYSPSSSIYFGIG